MKNKHQILMIHGGMTFKNQKDYLDFLKTREISIKKKIRWAEGYLDKELGKKFEIIRPRMPQSDDAKYEDWKIHFERHFPYLRNNIIIDNHIIEYDMGSLTGTKAEKISSAILTTALNAEDPEMFRNRVCSYVEELSKLPENILLVSHAGVGRMLETVKEGKESNMFYDIPAYGNASVTKIDWIK